MIIVDLKGNLLRDFAQLLDLAEDSLEIRLYLLVFSLVLLNHGQLVACSVTVLEEEGATETEYLAIGHDTNTVTQNISFIHVVCRKNDDSVVLVVLEHVPKSASGADVHTSCWFIK